MTNARSPYGMRTSGLCGALRFQLGLATWHATAVGLLCCSGFRLQPHDENHATTSTSLSESMFCHLYTTAVQAWRSNAALRTTMAQGSTPRGRR